MFQIRSLIAGLFTASVIIGLSACEKQPPAPTPPASKPSPAPAPAAAGSSTPQAPSAGTAAGTVTAAGVLFKVPEGWKSVPPSNQMRLAEIQVPDASGDPSKACVIAFSTAGGDVQSNITRWAGQMLDASGQPPKPETTTRDVNGLKVHTVELKGSYQGMGETPKPDWMLRGAIVESASGLLFVKMTGPAAAMEAAKANWNAMIDGIQKA
ncbi:MAG: hypothetical protein IT436_04705 [Phycisphaerales bacterium]|nr:hypothetical protein [Phycisphaerales bacterium]